MGWNSSSRLFLFFLILILSRGRGYCSSVGLSHYTYADQLKNGSKPVDDARHLTYVKLGVALGMFAITAGACSLPVIVITCITRRICTRRCSRTRSSASSPPNYASRTEELDALSPTFLLDPQSTESDEVLLSQGSDSHRRDLSQTHNHVEGVRSSLYEVDSHVGSSVSRDIHRLHWANSASDASITDGAEAGMLNGGVEISRNGAIPSASTKITRRRSSLRRIRLIKIWTSRINCFAAGIFLTTGLMDLFPDVNDSMAVALSALKINTHYPFSALFTLLGFFMVLTVEQGAHICQKRRRPSPTSNSAAPHNHHEHISHSHDHEMITGADIGTSNFQIVLLLTALSVHSVFEGLAVGLQRSVSEVVTLFSALLLHKLIMATSIGFSLATSYQVDGIMRSQWLGTLSFALASPVGVLIGWALIAQRSSPALLMGIAILQGLACGTFFFVVFCEMLPHEFGEDEELGVKDRFGKIASLVLGFALIATYIAFGPE